MKKILLLGLVTVLFFTTEVEAKLTIIQDGKTDYVILVDKQALETPKFAAQELQNYLYKVSGVKLPIVNSQVKGGKLINIGKNSFTKALGLSLKKVKPEGFIIKTVEDTLVLMGKDTPGDPKSIHWRFAPQTGTLYAVYTFLEKYLGICWFMPGEIGEVVPKTKIVSIPKINLKEEPSFISRRIGYLGRYNKKLGKFNRKEDLIWSRRNKCGWSLSTQFSHNWWYVLPLSHKQWPSWFKKKRKLYYPEHPEYFALVNGRRTSSYSVGRNGGQVCTSNPEVVKIFIEAAKDYFKKNPDVPMFSISPNDGGRFCECEKCRALDVKKYPDGRLVLTDRILTFYNKVGKGIYKSYPDKFLGGHVYSRFWRLPKRVKPYENLYLANYHNNAAFLFYNRQAKREHFNQIKDWSRLHDKILFMSFYTGYGFLGLPISTPPIIEDLIPFLKKQGMKGLYMAIGAEPCWGGRGLEYYLFARLMWNSSLNLTSLVDDYYEKFYGKETGKLIRRYHHLIEKGMREAAERNPKDWFHAHGANDYEKWIIEFYSGIRKQARKTLNQALQIAPDEQIKERVKLVSDNFRLAELTLDAFEANKNVESNPSLENSLDFKKVVDNRETFLEKFKNSVAIGYNTVRSHDIKFHLPVTKKLSEYYLSQQGKKKRIECRKITSAPIIDGILNDICWKKAAEIKEFLLKDTGKPAKIQTKAYLLYDKANLYLSLICKEPFPEKIKDVVTERDGKVWNENDIEIFLDINRDQKSFFQFVTNTLGTKFDNRIEKGENVFSYNPTWEVKIRINKNNWVAEIAIPFKELRTESPLPGDIWALNLCRVRRIGEPEYSCFSPTFGRFHKPERFGDLIFR